MNEQQPHTLPPSYFDDVYTANADPWGFEHKPYEQAKYADTVMSLPRLFYESAFEVGCSLGVLTARLAPRCGSLLAVDGSQKPLARARELCQGLGNVQIAQMQVPDEFPALLFDLVVLSEVGYYWSPADMALAQGKILEHLQIGGHLMLVHWTPWVHDYPLTGDEVHESFLALPGLRWLHGHRKDTYRLDVLERV